MNKKETTNLLECIDQATTGDKDSLAVVISSIQDLVFNLSLRMLGTFSDAEDAAQDIVLKIITHLSSFKKECSFSTWVFRIATNHLITYKKHMFANMPLTFAFYGDDIQHAKIQDVPDLTQNVEKPILAEELKRACTNVMLQCLDMENRCIFILGTMFQLDSRTAGEILGIAPDAYRQRLSRVRRKVADFLTAYCGEYGNGACRCHNRVNYAIQTHRLNPNALDYTHANALPDEKVQSFQNTMEEIDDLAAQFSFYKLYESPEHAKQFIQEFMDSVELSNIKNL